VASNNPAINHAVMAHALAYRRGADEATKRETKTALAAAKVEDYIERTLAAAPPLTSEQRQRIARLLTADGGGQA